MRALNTRLTLAVGFVLASSFAVGDAHAQDAAKAEQLAEVTGIEENFIGMQQQLMQAAAQRYVMTAQQAGLDEEQANSGRPAMEAVFDDIQTTLSWESMKPEVVRVFSQTFTNAEMDAAIAFYTSAEGRSFMEKQPQLMEQGGAIAEARMADALPRIQQAINAAVEGAGGTIPPEMANPQQ